MKLLTMSLSGALIICVIFLVRLLLQNKVHRTVWMVLWAVAVLRLLLPFSVAAHSSVFNLSLFRTPEPTVVQPAAVPPAQIVQSAEGTQIQDSQPVSAPNLLSIIWLAGAVAVGGYFTGNHLLAKRRYRFAVPIALAGLPKIVRVRTLDGLTSPLTYGLLHPVILLPPELPADEDRCRRVLAHELSHIRHADVAYKSILLLTAAVHWFNPFVWLMLFTASQDMEMRSDAEAIRALGGEKKEYAKTLVEAEETKLRSYLQTGFSFSSTAQRLRAIIHAKENKPLGVCTGILLAVLLFCVFCTGKVTPRAQATPESITEDAVTVTASPTETESEPNRMSASVPVTEVVSESEMTDTETGAPEPMTEVPEPTEIPTQTEMSAPAKIPEPTEPTEPEPQALQTPAPTDQLPTSYSVASPGSITLHIGESRSFSLQSISILSFFCDGDLSINSGTNGRGNSFTGVLDYCVLITANEEGIFQVYCTNEIGVTLLWATVTVLP